jgi:hypothetical protein
VKSYLSPFPSIDLPHAASTVTSAFPLTHNPLPLSPSLSPSPSLSQRSTLACARGSTSLRCLIAYPSCVLKLKETLLMPPETPDATWPRDISPSALCSLLWATIGVSLVVFGLLRQNGNDVHC